MAASMVMLVKQKLWGIAPLREIFMPKPRPCSGHFCPISSRVLYLDPPEFLTKAEP